MWTKTKEKLPPAGKYVLGRYNGGNWYDADQERVTCVVVKLVVGISQEERKKMEDGSLPDPEETGCPKRSKIYRIADQAGNNKVPYSWSTFGSLKLFGQQIEYWQEIEPLPEFNPQNEIKGLHNLL